MDGIVQLQVPAALTALTPLPIAIGPLLSDVKEEMDSFSSVVQPAVQSLYGLR